MVAPTLPLAGIRVVDYSHFLAGPYLSRCLAALGAEVIKVERPSAGDEAKSGAMAMVGVPGDAAPDADRRHVRGQPRRRRRVRGARRRYVLPPPRGTQRALRRDPRPVKAWTTARTVAECVAELEAADVPCTAVQNIDAVIADPQVRARNMIVEQQHPVLGKVRLANVPFRFADVDTTPKTPAPLLGQHNREVASQLGFSDAEIDAMAADGVLYAEEAVARLPAH